MKRKITAILLACCLSVTAFVSCGKGNQKENDGIAYVWSDDYATCTATKKKDGETHKETVSSKKSISQEKSCVNDEITKYTATFKTEEFGVTSKEVVTGNKLGHAWSTEWTVDVEPTSETAGSKSHHCTRCDEKKDVTEIPSSEAVAVSNLEYVLNADGREYTVKSMGKCSDAEIVIASKLLGKPVTMIGEEAFSNATNVTSIKIPNTIEKIGARAFYGCSALKEITIPSSVTKIESQIFYKSGVNKVYYDSGFSAGDNPFMSDVETVVFGNGAPAKICQDSAKLKNVTFKDGAAFIGYGAFKNCVGLKSVTVPASVERIDRNAFSGCSSLETVNLSRGLREISSGAFANCSVLKNVTIPDTVSVIGNNAFSGCEKLKSVVIPNRVTSIGFSAFSSCSELTSVTIPDSVTTIGDNAFFGCIKLRNVVIPDSVLKIDAFAFSACGFTSITIPDSVTTIGISAFADCKSMTTLVIGKGVLKAEFCAFAGCTGLTDVRYKGTVAEWRAIKKDDIWRNIETVTVKCSDGQASARD